MFLQANCKYVTISSVFVLYVIKMETLTPPPPPKKNNFFWGSNWEFFVSNWEKKYFMALGMGPKFGPKIG